MKAKDVIEYFGSQTATAKALGVSIPSVWAWVRNNEVPELRQYQIEKITNGNLKAVK
jgi:DNA-binding transcriptional regulator YdaS (Cro superfamily)